MGGKNENFHHSDHLGLFGTLPLNTKSVIFGLSHKTAKGIKIAHNILVPNYLN